jgi:hypothetical protein
MYIAKIRNAGGQTVTLSQNETQYQILSINGLNPPSAQINLSESLVTSGGRFNSAHVGTRNITIDLKINGNAEANRLALYQLFPPSSLCTFFFQNDTRNVKIDGYVEVCDVGLFEQSQQMSVSIICPEPYFNALTKTTSGVAGAAAQISNGSDVPIGFEVDAYFNQAANKIKITKAATGEFIEITNSFAATNSAYISTIIGQKTVKKIVGSESTNLFPSLNLASTFFQLSPGNTLLNFEVDDVPNDGAVTFDIIRTNQYMGV